MPGKNSEAVFNVRNFGARGDGVAIDSPAINRAIDAAAAAGGGTIHLPPGTYACYSIRLKSNIALYIDQGATILAAPVPAEGMASGGFDAPEPARPWADFQDYGHDHWHNSMIWGEDLHDLAILGPGLIHGKGISVGLGKEEAANAANYGYGPEALVAPELPGMANKAIALKNCRNVILRDFAILLGGEFGILATATDNLTIDNIKIDTNRDGINVDSCLNTRITRCSINAPWEDAISPKSSYSLGYLRDTNQLLIADCYLTGAYQLGTMLDGTWKRWPQDAKVAHNARIKCGTETNGNFRNITISNCIFERSRGIGLESFDGAHLEDISINGITMRDCANAPLMLRLEGRLRGPKGLAVGTMRRISISNIVSTGADATFGGAGIISGIPGHNIEDVQISNLYMEQTGGGTPEMAHFVQPNLGKDPTKYGNNPSQGFFVRHVRNIDFSHVEIATKAPDARPAFWLNDVEGVDLYHVKAPRSSPFIAAHDTRNLRIFGSRNAADMTLEHIEQKIFS